MIYLPVSIRPSAPFPIDNLSICLRIFFKFWIHIVITDEWYGIVNGQNPSSFNSPCSYWKNSFWYIVPLLFINETSQLCLSSKVTYCDKEPSLRLFQFMRYLPLIDPKNIF